MRRKSPLSRGTSRRDRWWGRGWRRLHRFVTGLSLPGIVIGTLAFAASTQPSLVPRGWIYQGAVSGLSLLVGYTAGVIARWLLRVLGLPRMLPASWHPRARQIVEGVFVVIAIVSLTGGAAAQRRLAELWGLEPTHQVHLVTSLLLALVLFLLLLLIGRGLRAGIAALARVLGRWVPRPVSAVVSFVAIVTVAVVVVSGTFNELVLDRITASFLTRDVQSRSGVAQPSVPERSGSPDSLQRWEELGYEGRTFAAGGPTREEIEAFTGRPALEPIRVYGGAASVADDLTDVDLDALAQEVVAELDRTGAWDREVVAVVTTTGTGWVDALAVASLEYLHGGDTAVAAMQYSVNPSWVQLVLDLDKPAAAGTALFDAVQTRWSELPEESRPQASRSGSRSAPTGARPRSPPPPTSRPAPPVPCGRAHPASPRCTAPSRRAASRAARRSTPSSRPPQPRRGASGGAPRTAASSTSTTWGRPATRASSTCSTRATASCGGGSTWRGASRTG